MKRSTITRMAVSLVVVASAFVLMTASSVAASSLPTLTLAVSKNAITVGGAEVSGAVNVAISVTGEPSDQPTLILLKPGVTAAELGKAVSKFGMDTPFDAIDPYGTLEFDSQVVAKGKTITDQALLPAGNYVAVNNGNGFQSFTISASSSPASLPAPGGTVKAIDFGYRGAATLHDGELVRFENDGYLIHMVEYAKTGSVSNAKKAEKFLLAGQLQKAKKYVIAPPGQFAGPLSTGAMEQETITQSPGVYVILCLMNAEDGRDHYQLGMFRTIRITK
jgi:hypothetical protein